MKRLFALILILSAVLSLFACGGGEGDGGGDESLPTVFSPEAVPTVIRGEGAPDTEETSAIVDAIRTAIGRMPTVKDASSEVGEHEIVFGDCSRPIAKRAAELLGEAKDGYVSYIIYTDGTSVAILYRDNDDGIAKEMATKAFLALFAGADRLLLDAGTVKSETVELSVYYGELGERRVEEAYAALEAEAGRDIADAIRDLYRIYGDGALEWLANLYDPSICFCGECAPGEGCGGGGFYYSESARDTGGYLPDAESTYQALSMLASTGMADGRGGYAGLIDGEMREAIITFTKSLQHPNGYFYHPQWGKDFTDTMISRRSRDLDWCTSILEAFGEMPKYDAPNGTKGENRNTGAAYRMKMPLGESAACAVSRVVGVAAETYAGHLESDATFRAYLAGKDIGSRSYHVGSEILTQTSQIKARDAQLAEEGKDYSLMAILIEWLDEHQNTESGHWHTESDYYGINGLYKIARIYNAAGVAMKHAGRAAASAIAAISSDEEPDAVTDTYNMWAAIAHCVNNLHSFGGEAGVAEAARIRSELREMAPEAIAVTKVKTAKFLKEDGSFSYTQNASAHTSQGMPAAVPGTNEGDVNATSIAIASLSGSIYSALGLSEYKVPIYTYGDFLEFKETVDSIGYVVKLETPDADEPATFDDDDIGSSGYGVSSSLESAGSAAVVDDPREGRPGNVFELRSLSGGRDYVLVPCKNTGYNGSRYVFEGSFCVTETDPSYTTQITMGGCYMFTLRADASGNVKIVEASSNSEVKSRTRELGVAAKVGEWFDVRVEFYKGTHDTVRIKFFFNGELVAVSDNYYDAAGTKLESGVGTPSTLFDATKIFVMRSSAATILIDDVVSYKDDGTYQKPEGDGPAINVDAPSKPVIYEGFDDGKMPESIDPTSESSGGSVGIVDDPRGSGKVLEIKSFAGGRDFFYLNAQDKADANCYVFEGDFCMMSTDPEYTVQMTMGSVYMLTLRATGKGTVKIVEASSNSEGKSRTQELGLEVAVGEWFSLRAEYYLGDHGSVRIKVYFNGELVAVTDNYYDAGGGKLSGTGTPSRTYESVRVIVMRSYNATLLVDNVAAYKTVKEYERCDEDLIINVDKK